jgi:hypothetical protein
MGRTGVARLNQICGDALSELNAEMRETLMLQES